LNVEFDRNEAAETRTGIVRLIDGNGEQQFVTLTQFGAGSKNPLRQSESINMYPNPTSGTTIVDLPEKGLADIAVFDVSGRLVLETQAQSRAELDLNNQPNGNYFVRITLNGTTTTLRLTVQR